MNDWKQHYVPLRIGGLLEHSRAISDALDREIRETLLDFSRPRFGPRRVLNDEQQVQRDRDLYLIDQLEDVAREWGVDLHEGCEW